MRVTIVGAGIGGLAAAAHRDKEPRAGFGLGGWHKAKGDGLAQRWGKAAAGDNANRGAGGIEDFGIAHRMVIGIEPGLIGFAEAAEDVVD